MLIVCPRCETIFSLSDELFKPGKKARCSQCGNVFPMTAPAPEPASPDPSPGLGQTFIPPPKRKLPSLARYRQALIGGAAVLLVLLLAYGGWLIVKSFFGGDDGPEAVGRKPASDRQEEYKRLFNSISLGEIRQFFVENAQIGRLMVIQGVAVNISPGPKDYVTIDARVLDEKGNALAQQRQLCGVPLTLFQLQSLSESEIAESLSNRITIRTNNTNIPEGGKVPFVVVFPNPPETMRTFEVRVIDVRDSAPDK